MRGIVIIYCNNVKDVRDFCTLRNDNSGEEMFESLRDICENIIT